MRAYILAAILATMLTLPGDGLAASFDCSKARSVPEKLICLDETLSRLDSELGVLVEGSKRRLSGQEFFDAEPGKTPSSWLKEYLVTEWRWREANCRDAECIRRWFTKQFAMHRWINTFEDAIGDFGVHQVLQTGRGDVFIGYGMATHTRNVWYKADEAEITALPDGELVVLSEDPLRLKFVGQKSYFEAGGAFWFDTERDEALRILDIALDPDSWETECVSRTEFLALTGFPGDFLDSYPDEQVCIRGSRR